MMKFIYRLQLLNDKKKQLEVTKIERAFVLSHYSKEMKLDTKEKREKLGKIKSKAEKATAKEKQEAMNIENEINQANQFKQIVEKSDRAIKELEAFIALIKKELWK